MPQRFLKPGITTSDRWNACGWQAQSFYIRLITLADDFGRYDARPKLLRSQAFPLHDDVTCEQVTALCRELHEHGLAIFFRHDGREYFQLTSWSERVRSNESKYPKFSPSCEQMFATCGQLTANVGEILPPKPSPSPSSSPPPAPEHPPANDAHIPTLKEVSTFGSMGAGIPADYCAHFESRKHELKSWLTPRGELCDWKREITRWWSRDKPTWSQRNGKQSLAISRISAEKEAATLNEELKELNDSMQYPEYATPKNKARRETIRKRIAELGVTA